MKLRLKKIIIDISRFILSVLPMGIYILVNREKYFQGTITTQGWSCFIYIGFLIMIVALKDSFSNLFKKNSQLKFCLVLLVFSYFFKYVAEEIIWFSLMGVIGGGVSIIPDLFSKEIAKDIDAKRSGVAMAEAFSEQSLKVVKK